MAFSALPIRLLWHWNEFRSVSQSEQLCLLYIVSEIKSKQYLPGLYKYRQKSIPHPESVLPKESELAWKQLMLMGMVELEPGYVLVPRLIHGLEEFHTPASIKKLVNNFSKTNPSKLKARWYFLAKNLHVNQQLKEFLDSPDAYINKYLSINNGGLNFIRLYKKAYMKHNHAQYSPSWGMDNAYATRLSKRMDISASEKLMDQFFMESPGPHKLSEFFYYAVKILNKQDEINKSGGFAAILNKFNAAKG